MTNDLVHDRDAAWALLTEWTQSEALRRHALGVEASVLLLTVLPFLFLLLMHFMAPALLVPLGKPLGEIVFALAVAWMVLGYRVMQRISEAPREERIALNEAAL